MIEKIKKLLFSITKNKIVFFAFLFFIFIGFLVPLKPASAGWVNSLIGALQYSPIRSIGAVLFVIIGISNFLALASGAWLMCVTNNVCLTSDGFFLNKISYVNPDGNEAIRVGLGVTQGFANMVLVLVLVFIALAIILRLKDYEAKRLLPIFVMVALLINFAPVLCGLVVDASNIIMNYFLNKGAGYQLLVNQQIMNGQAILAYAGTWMDFNAVSQNETLLFMILTIAINFSLFLILSIFSFVFIARHLAIWLLVILSPLAFAFYILPSTKHLAKKWWEQLLHWSFVGVTCSFFLYLGGYFINFGIKSNDLGRLETSIDVLPFIVATAFLYMGLILGFKTSAIGAGAIIGYVTAKGKAIEGKIIRAPLTAGKTAGKWVGKRAGAFVKEKIIPERLKRGAEELKTRPRYGQEKKGFKGWTMRTFNAPWYHARRVVGNVFGGAVSKTQAAEIEKTKEEMKNKSVSEHQETFNKALTDREKIGILASAKEKGFADQLNISDSEMTRLEGQTRKWLDPKEIRKIFPDFAKKIKEAEKEFKEETSTALREAFDATEDVARKIGILSAARNEGELDNMGLTQSEIEDLYNKASAVGPKYGRTVAKMMPHLAGPDPTIEPNIYDPTTMSADPGNDDIIDIVRSMKLTDYGKITGSSIDNRSDADGGNIRSRTTVSAMVENMTKEQFKKAFDHLGIDFIEAIERDLDDRMASNPGSFATREQALEGANKRLYDFITSSLGAGLIDLS